MNFSGSSCLLVASFLVTYNLPAQNLVPNGSFEEYLGCPGGHSQHPSEFRVMSWRTLTFGTPDYFNSCSDGGAAVPYNWAGVSDAYDGFGYTGLYTWLSIKDFREYLHCKLIEPLVKDSLYHIEFRYKLSSYSKYSTDRLGLLLSDSLTTVHNDLPLKIPATISFVKDSALTPETGTWELAAADYRAKGNEQFLTIGNFDDNSKTDYFYIKFRPVQEPMLADAAYYYIDDVRIVPRFAEPATIEPSIPVFTGDEPDFNTAYVLKNIQFEFNSYALMPESFFDLDVVVRYLIDHPGVSVEVAGHTDDTGEERYNELLSANRAKSAAAYLISKGVERKRISTLGYGESKPLVRDITQRARDINRRVEIRFFR